MNKKEWDAYMKSIEKAKREIVSCPKKSRQFLTDVGILTKSGRLSKKFKSSL